MNNIKEITIKKVKGREREFIASFYDDFLKVNYSVYFRDNVFGAVGLSRFSEMIKSSYSNYDVNVEIIDDWRTENDCVALEILNKEAV